MEEKQIFPLNWQDELHPYEMAQRAQDFYQQKYPNGLPLFPAFETEILKDISKFNYFNRAIIYTFLMIDHPSFEKSQDDRLHFRLYFPNLTKRQRTILYSIRASSSYSAFSNPPTSMPCKFARKKVIEKYNQNKSYAVDVIISHSGLLRSLAHIVQNYATEYSWGISLMQIMSNPDMRQLIAANFSPGGKFICLKGCMINDISGLHLLFAWDKDHILDLSDNLLESINLDDIPHYIECLYLFNNIIETIQGKLPKYKLRLLSLLNNSLQNIPQNLSMLVPNIEFLDFSDNCVTDIPCDIDNLIKLRDFSISEDKLTPQAREKLRKISQIK
jgi:hypothetical protein